MTEALLDGKMVRVFPLPVRRNPGAEKLEIINKEVSRSGSQCAAQFAKRSYSSETGKGQVLLKTGSRTTGQGLKTS
jgi:hypothetical protein